MSVLPKVRSGRFSTWRTGSMNRRIFAAAVTVGSLNLVAKLVTTGKELVVAGRFGTGDALDAFFIAWLLPSVAINVIGGAFGPAFLPTYIDVRERRGQAAADRLLAASAALIVAVLIATAALLGLAAPWLLPLVGSSFSPAKLALTRSLLYALLPALAVGGLTSAWTALLNARERFAAAAVVPAITPLLTAVALVAAGRHPSVHLLAFATVGGAVLETL